MAYTSSSDVVNAAKRILIVALFLLNIKGGVSQCLIPRVERSRNYASETSPPPGSNFSVVLGQPVKFFCYCPEYTQFEMLEILQGEETIKSQSSCEPLLHTIPNASYSDEGQYICKGHNGGHMTTSYLGNLTIIDSAVVHAEPRQYGQLNTQTKLLCNTSLDINEYNVLFSWFTAHGQTKVAIESSENGSLIINNAQFTHGGVYTCQVYFARIDIRIEKVVELVIIDSPATTFSPSSIPVGPPTIATTPLPSSMTPPTTTPTPNGRPTTTLSNTDSATSVESTSVLVTILAVLGTSLAISFILLVVLITYVVLHCSKVHKCYYQSQEKKA